MILSEHLVKCDTDDKPFDTYWYKYTVGRLQQVFLAVSVITNNLYKCHLYNMCLYLFDLKVLVLNFFSKLKFLLGSSSHFFKLRFHF